MNIEQFEQISLTLGVGSLILYMLFIMYRLGKDSNAGIFGTAIIFLTLGLGVFGYLAKNVIQLFVEV